MMGNKNQGKKEIEFKNTASAIVLINESKYLSGASVLPKLLLPGVFPPMRRL